MNLLRERWAALECQTLFMLLPFNYRYLTSAADHLKRWISLKVHLLGTEASNGHGMKQSQDAEFPGLGLLSPDVARSTLATLERELGKAIQRSKPPAALVRRYYLPMLAAAISVGELRRAERLRDKARDYSIGEADMPQWLQLNVVIELQLLRLEEAEKFATKLADWAKGHGDLHLEAAADFYLGHVAEEQRDFATAEEWYRKSLAIKEKQGNEHGAASTYHQLGRIAQEQRDFATAEEWYRKSLAIEEKQGNEHGAASTYHQLGRIAEEAGNCVWAGSEFLKAVAIFSRMSDQHFAQIALRNFARVLRASLPEEQARLYQMAREALGDEQVKEIEQLSGAGP